MQVKDIMTKDVIWVDPEIKISKIAEILFKNRFHGIPVVKNGKVVGIITEDDFFSQKDDILFLPEYINFLKNFNLAEQMPDVQKNNINKIINIRAKDIMTTECITITPETGISELLKLIKKTNFNTIPVVDSENRILGIVTLVDVLGLLNNEIADNAKKYIDGKRGVDDLVENVDSRWKNKFILIKETRVKTWKGALILAFIAGSAVFLIWIISF